MALVWDEDAGAAMEKNLPTGKVACPSCGVTNSTVNVLCRGCGTNLATAASLTQSRPASRKISAGSTKEAGKKRAPGKRLESWKTLSIAGALVVLVILGIGVFRNPPKEVSPQNQSLAITPDAGINPTLMNDIDALQKSVDANPKDAGSLLRLANTLHDAKFMQRAIEIYKRYLLLKPADPDARVDMGICYFESGDSPTALKEMRTALKNDPKHQMATFNIGIVNLNQGNIQESNEWFKKTVALDPKTEVAQRAQQILSQHSTIQQ
jgi:cytochrome c-type biogenesis protein CcmH/NrfG